MRAPGRHSFILLALATLGAACDWRDFDDIKKRTPVLAVAASDAFGTTDDFGRYVLPLSAPAAGATGGRFVVSAASTGAVALVSIDGKGQASTINSGDSKFRDEEITSMAEVPGGKRVLLGAHQGGPNTLGAAYVLTLGATLGVSVLAEPPADTGFGFAVGAGALTGGVDPDFVVLSASQLTVFPDGDPDSAVVSPPSAATDCQITFAGLSSRDNTSRAMVVADLKGTGTDQIVVGTPAPVGQGAVAVFDVDATGVATCAFAFRGAPSRFGQALAVGDFDGDDQKDLLIGAPPEGAFWIRGPLTAASPILPVTLTKGVGNSQLGFAVGAGDVDGTKGDEALVGDPEAKVGDELQVGEVRIVGAPMLTVEQPVVRRQSPEATDAFGVQVGALPFCSTPCPTGPAPGVRRLLLAGGRTRAFTFFRLDPKNPAETDPRVP
jgi:hypothetical protein